jgi:hypothetical protein
MRQDGLQVRIAEQGFEWRHAWANSSVGEFAIKIASGYCDGMTVEAIKEAISALPEQDRHSLASWLNELEYDDWDNEMAKDFLPGGRGAAVVERVKREIAAGEAKPFGEGLTEARARRRRSGE